MKKVALFFLFTAFSFFCQVQPLGLSSQVTSANPSAITFNKTVVFNTNQNNFIKSRHTSTHPLSKLNTPIHTLDFEFINAQSYEQHIIVTRVFDLKTMILEHKAQGLYQMTCTLKQPELKRNTDQHISNITDIVIREAYNLQAFKQQFDYFVNG